MLNTVYNINWTELRSIFVFVKLDLRFGGKISTAVHILQNLVKKANFLNILCQHLRRPNYNWSLKISNVKQFRFPGIFLSFFFCYFLKKFIILKSLFQPIFNKKKFLMIFFCLRGRFPSLPWDFLHKSQWSCSALGSLWEMPDSNPGPLPQKSGALPMSHYISLEPWPWDRPG